MSPESFLLSMLGECLQLYDLHRCSQYICNLQMANLLMDGNGNINLDESKSPIILCPKNTEYLALVQLHDIYQFELCLGKIAKKSGLAEDPDFQHLPNFSFERRCTMQHIICFVLGKFPPVKASHFELHPSDLVGRHLLQNLRNSSTFFADPSGALPLAIKPTFKPSQLV
jgi:hypothetical protein